MSEQNQTDGAAQAGALALLQSFAGFVADEGGVKPSQDRPPRLGTVAPGYVSGPASVIFDGEVSAGVRTYVATCRVHAGQRVLLLPVANTYVILGAVDGTDDAEPGRLIEGLWTVAPAGYTMLDGAVELRAAMPRLFALIGTSYNTGGETGLQFRKPDGRGRVTVQKAASGTFLTLGEKVGSETHTHAVTQLIAAIWPGFWKTKFGASWTGGNSNNITAGAGSGTISNGASIEGLTDAGSSVQPSLVVNRAVRY